MSIVSFVRPDDNEDQPSLQDDLWIIATSNNSGQTDFKYVFDIYDVSGNQMVRAKVYPDPSNGKGYFNAGSVVRNTIKFNWFTPVAPPTALATEKSYLYEPDFSGQIGSFFSFRIGEDWSGVTTLNMASGLSFAYNFATPLYQRKVNKAKERIWATNRPFYAYNNLTDKYLVGMRHYGSNLRMRVKTYNAAGTLLNDITSPGTWGFVVRQDPYGNSEFVQMDLGKEAVESTIDNSIIGSDVAYYDVMFQNRPTVKPFRIYIQCDGKYDPINLYFMNNFGMFDTARFNLVNKLSLDVERKSFQKRDYRFENTQVSYKDTNSVYYESKINYAQALNWKYKLTMDYPTDEEYDWLYELIVSPQIYAGIGDGYYPVTIVQTNYEYHKRVWGGLKTFEIDIEVNQKRYQFRR